MIAQKYILDWKVSFPWIFMHQVEQDLLISRVVIAIYSDPFLASRLAWRGGTALYKLHVNPSPRYSEDIDLVLIKAEPMGPILDRLREVLSFIPDMQVKGRRYNHVLKLRFTSEVEQLPCRIKVEINCNEHFTELGFEKVPFSVDSPWFSGSCEVTAYRFEEMLGTKFNAIFGRKKTRDIFDMDYVLRQSTPDVEKVLQCWRRYKTELGEALPSWREYVLNVEDKLQDKEYRRGMDALLRPGIEFDIDSAWANLRSSIVDRLMTPEDRRKSQVQKIWN
ncbi:MAG: nucleotidyl transferase AbiEii/AbiGii toxin family protein [Kiritimatiellae bacterium]|nr:nucleotidyl transferase AbiEii/AbiGii toxin family protein [Kiritimatiellia bacterium]